MQTNKIAMLNHNTFAGVRSCESPIKGVSARSAGPLRPNCQMSILALVCSLRVLGTARALWYYRMRFSYQPDLHKLT